MAIIPATRPPRPEWEGLVVAWAAVSILIFLAAAAKALDYTIALVSFGRLGLLHPDRSGNVGPLIGRRKR